MPKEPDKQTTPEEEQDTLPPPFFKTWKGMYVFVLGTLAVLIVLFYLITIHYA